MKSLIAVVLVLIFSGFPAKAGPVDLDRDTLFVGHSLVAFDMPAILQHFMAHAGGSGRTEVQVINGAPLSYNWKNGATAQGLDARSVLPSGRFGALVLTEAIPLESHLMYSATVETAAQYHALATAADSAAQVFIYETWHDLRSGTGAEIEWDVETDLTWRERIEAAYPGWMSIVEGVNNQSAAGSKPVRLIPAGQAMGALQDAIDARQVPGIDAIGDLFDDTIHFNATGAYFVALVMAETIYGIDAPSLPYHVPLADHGEHRIAEETARALQAIAAKTVAATE